MVWPTELLLVLHSFLILVLLLFLETISEGVLPLFLIFFLINSSACSITVSNTTCYFNHTIPLLVFIYIMGIQTIIGMYGVLTDVYDILECIKKC